MANTNLTRIDPFGDNARADPFRGFEDFFHDFRFMPALRDFEAQPRIKVEVAESDATYTVKAEIPGVKKEDIKVDIEGNQVSISAETKKDANNEKNGGSVLRNERYYGKQYRSFTLVHDVDDEHAIAKYENGVLELTLPKKAARKGKNLVVN